MAKLYWRIKKNGKWTWRPAQTMDEIPLGAKWTVVMISVDEEESP